MSLTTPEYLGPVIGYLAWQKGLSRFGDEPGLSAWAQPDLTRPSCGDLPFPGVVRDVMKKEASERCVHWRGTQPRWPALALKMEKGPMPRNADGKEGEQESCWTAELYRRDHGPRRPGKARS